MLQGEAAEQVTALRCMNKEPQSAVLSPLTSRGSAGLDQGRDALDLGLACSCLIALALQCLVQPLLG